MKKLITIIVPVYKVEAFLPQCVDSILAQTYKNFELFLVDDGSPDRCGELCDQYAAADRRITVIHKQNGGLSDARNVAMDQMHGEYVTFIDSDDSIDKSYLQKMLYCAEKYDADIVQSDFTREYKQLGSKTSPNSAGMTIICKDDIFRDYLHMRIPKVFAWGKLYRTSLFEGIRYPFGLIDEDNYTTYKVMYASKVFVQVNFKMYFYRVNPNSIMHMEFSEKKFGILNAIPEIREFLKDKTTRFDADVDYYEMRQNIQVYNNAIQANAVHDYPERIDVIYHSLCEYSKLHRSIDLKYRVLLLLLRSNRYFYENAIIIMR